MAEDCYLKPRIDGLTEEQIERLYISALEVLEKTGVKVSHDEALVLLEKAGCKINSDSLVKIPRCVVEEALQTVPNEIVMYDRNGKKAMELNGRNTYYGVGSDLPHTYDHQTGRLRAPFRPGASGREHLSAGYPARRRAGPLRRPRLARI